MKIAVEKFKEAFAAHLGDVPSIMATLGISRATFFRLKKEALAANGAAVAPVAPVTFQASGNQAFPAAPPVAAQAPVAIVPVEAAPAPQAAPVVEVPVAQASEVPQALPKADGNGAAIQRDAGGNVNVGAVEGSVDLSMYIPQMDGDLADYVPRMTYYEKLVAFYQAARSVFMFGEAGVGKTSLARYLAAQLKLPFLSVSCDVLLGFGELLGQINITDGTSHFVEGLFLKFFQVPSVILIDEVTALDAAKSFKLHQVLGCKEVFVKEADRGVGRIYKMHANCFIILAGNPPHNGRYNGVNKANVALVDRPDAILEIPELTDEELRAIIPAHDEKDNLLRYYHEARAVIQNNNLRTTFSVRVAKRIIGILSLGMGISDAVADGFLNGVKLTAGDTAHKALFDLANGIWDLGGKAKADAPEAK